LPSALTALHGQHPGRLSDIKLAKAKNRKGNRQSPQRIVAAIGGLGLHAGAPHAGAGNAGSWTHAD
jgi:hypothetical protein